MRATRNMVRFLLVTGIIFLLPVLLWAQSGPYPTGEPYCILNAPAPALGENCFQFYLCAARNSNMCSAPPDPAWPGGWGPCILSPTAQRSGYAIDDNAHPPWEPRPFLNYEAAEYFASLLSPYGGDWYGCFGPPAIDQLPDRTPPVAVAPSVQGYCLLSKPDLYQPDNIDPPICFEFYKADTSVTPITQRLASIIDGECVMTDFGARQGWRVDPNYGGPYVGPNAWMESEVAMNIVSRYGDDFYGCLDPRDELPPGDFGGGGGTPPPGDFGGDSGTPPSPMAQDCSDIRAQYYKKCEEMTGYYVNLNCEKHDYYSGCALDVAGCIETLIAGAFSDNRCGEPGYLGCAQGQTDAYLGCLQSCNARFVERQLDQSLTDCRVACQRSFEAGLRECESLGR